MLGLSRREWLAGLASVGGALLVLGRYEAEGGQRRAARARTRRRVRRRIRRRAVRRTVLGRPVWVVPVGIAAGWELMLDNRIVVVMDIKNADKDGSQVQIAVVEDRAGKVEEVEILREDTDENRKELGGSVLSDDDKKTPGIEVEVYGP